MKNVFIGLAFFVVVLGGTSCVRYRTTTNHTRDTVTVTIRDTITMVQLDTTATIRVEKSIDSVFIEIEKDCPQLSGKTGELRDKIKESCTHESLSGGSLIAWSPQLKENILVKFEGNKAVVILNEQREIFTETITIEHTVKQSLLKQILNTWFMWVPGLLFFLLWAVSRFT